MLLRTCPSSMNNGNVILNKSCSKLQKKFRILYLLNQLTLAQVLASQKSKRLINCQRQSTEAFRFDAKVLVEKALNVLELEVAALESLEPNAEPIVSVVGEIKPRHEFYSYEAKYLDENGAELIIPSSLPEE